MFDALLAAIVGFIAGHYADRALPWIKEKVSKVKFW